MWKIQLLSIIPLKEWPHCMNGCHADGTHLVGNIKKKVLSKRSWIIQIKSIQSVASAPIRPCSNFKSTYYPPPSKIATKINLKILENNCKIKTINLKTKVHKENSWLWAIGQNMEEKIIRVVVLFRITFQKYMMNKNDWIWLNRTILKLSLLINHYEILNI